MGIGLDSPEGAISRLWLRLLLEGPDAPWLLDRHRDRLDLWTKPFQDRDINGYLAVSLLSELLDDGETAGRLAALFPPESNPVPALRTQLRECKRRLVV